MRKTRRKGSPPPLLLEQTPSPVLQEMPAKPLEQAGFEEEKEMQYNKVLRTAQNLLSYYVESSETIFLK